MHHSQPDGMGADRYRERHNMQEARQETPTPDWELAALDADGNELYRTEYVDTEAEAEELIEEIDPADHDGVDRFEAVRTEE